MSINGEIITTSGFAEVILEVTKDPIGVGMVEKSADMVEKKCIGFEIM